MSKKQAAQSSAIVKWDEELAKEAEIAAAAEANAGGGQWFSIKGGILTWNDAPVPNNQMAAVIVGSLFENVYYEGEYDPDEPRGPSCFAFGAEEKGMAPHPVAREAGSAQEGPCATCPKNEFGSADKGKGKACKNTRRLALVSAGQLDANGKFTPADPESFDTSPLGLMRLPVTSVKGYANFVKNIANGLKRPPHGVATKVKVIPDPKSQYKVTFEPLVALDADLRDAINRRRDEAKPLIEQPYTPFEEQEDKPKAKGKASKGKARKY